MVDPDTKKKLMARLRRVEGQIGGLRRMLESDDECVDILLQLRAASGALEKASMVLLESHIRTCVADAFAGGDSDDREQRVDELMEVFGRYGGGR